MKRCLLLALLLLTLAGLLSSAQAKFMTKKMSNGDTLSYEIAFDGHCVIRGWKGTSGKVIIPEEIDGVPVTEINSMAFRGKGMKELVIPDSVRKIGVLACHGCASLERVTLPDTLESVPRMMFVGCASLKEVNIPAHAAEIGEMAFAGCEALTSVALPEGLTSIGDAAFQGCTALEEINLPKSLTAIGNNCFLGCANLSKLVLPEGLTELGWGAFQNCTGIRELTLPDSLSKVGYNPFVGMRLERLVVSPGHPYLDYEDGVLYSKADDRLVGCAEPDLLPAHYEVRAGTTYVEECAFYLCRNLESLVLPDSVHTLYAFALAGCDRLKDVRLGAGLEKLGSWTFRQCDALTELTFPDGVKKLPGWVIDNCPNLERVVLPAGVTLTDNFISNCPKAVLVVARNSTAERQLRASGIPYVYPDSTMPPTASPQPTSAGGEASGGAASPAASPQAEPAVWIGLRDLQVDPDQVMKYVVRGLILFALARFAWLLWHRDK